MTDLQKRLDELAEQKRKIELAVEKAQEFEADIKRDAVAAVLAEMRKYGVTLEELHDQAGWKPASAASAREFSRPRVNQNKPPKFRNPADHAQTWSGNGSEPTWAAEYRTTETKGKGRAYRPEIFNPEWLARHKPKKPGAKT